MDPIGAPERSRGAMIPSDFELVERAHLAGVLVEDHVVAPGLFLQYAREHDPLGSRTDAGYRACTQWFFPRYDLGPDVRERGEGLLAIVRSIFRESLERYRTEIGRFCTNLSYCTHIEWPSIVRYEAARGDAFHVHADNWSAASALRQFALIVYLNDVAEGGETFFPELDLTIAPRAGRVLLFPAFATHAHGARAPKNEDKWVLVAWLRYPDFAEGEKPYGPGFPRVP